MIKILWDQCEAATEVPDYSMMQQAAYLGSARQPTRTEQCSKVGTERTFADGAKHIICDGHWTMLKAIVDSDGAKHVKGEK